MRARAMLTALALLLACAPTAAATFPGRNGQIAVASGGQGRAGVIWAGPADGSVLSALPSPCPDVPPGQPESCVAAAPAWSPDGTRLAFTVIRRSQPQVWIVGADGTSLRRLEGARGYDPAWSPDGRRLVFSVDAPDERDCHWRDLYTIGADGSDLALLIRRGDDPDWSARGQIAYERLHEHWTGGPASECDPTSTVAVLTPGGRPRRPALGTDPSWAPGGRAVAFVGPGGVRRKRVGAPGGGRLLAGGILVYEPTWSPDGRSILYRSASRLKLIGARRGRARALAFDAPGAPDFQSSWQAR